MARSGSTLLSLVLAGSPDVFACGETTRIWRRWYRYRRSGWSAGGQCICNRGEVRPVGGCAFWTPQFVQSIGRRGVYQCIGRRAQAMYGSRVLVVSDKTDYHYRPRLARGDRLDLLVMLFKRPEAQVHSYLRRGESLGATCRGYTKIHNRLIRLADRHGIPCRFYRYEEFVARPGPVVQDICQAIGASFRQEMLEYWRPVAHRHTLCGIRGCGGYVVRGQAYPIRLSESWQEGLDAAHLRAMRRRTDIWATYDRLCEAAASQGVEPVTAGPRSAESV